VLRGKIRAVTGRTRAERPVASIVADLNPATLPRLRDLFKRHFRGAGSWNHAWPDAEREILRRLVGEIVYWACDGSTEEPCYLRRDESRIGEADEAWVPVVTPDGPGVLLWPNSD
jgi:hypothetical protein